jgi:hypothetical protein
MDAYFDPAIIVKLCVREATSPDAIRLVGAYVAKVWKAVPPPSHTGGIKSRRRIAIRRYTGAE